ncbi:uncharacterized protein LOC121731044 [Aricia agestis]|uniref:uncharacterized protein LOC121731044 n=1 Tax=Aricia agestis TaxID=91739 RepID=UPI001C20A002|nr:uncharacterized protein LOC121731044 [Aricia agestis]
MCRTVHAVLQTLICGVQMLVRVLMTILLMIENLIRMVLQTLYNFISFMLQLLSLIPICVVFLVSARLKCFMCGGGGGCQPGRGGACDCIMSLVAIVILFFIFKSTGVMDKIFYSMGYAKAAYEAEPYVPTPGDITECSRNDTDQDIEYLVRTETYIATFETSAAAYLDALVEDYTQMLVTTKKKSIVPNEPEETEYFPLTTKENVIFTSPMVDVFTPLTKAATEAIINYALTKEGDEMGDIVATEATDQTTTTESNTIKAVNTIPTEAIKIVITTTTEAVEMTAEEAIGTETQVTNEIISDIKTTGAIYTEAPEATEIINDEITSTSTSEAAQISSVFVDEIQTGISPTRVADHEVATQVDEKEETGTTNEVVDSETALFTKEALDIEITDTPFDTPTEAPDMSMSDTPNLEGMTETTLESSTVPEIVP